MASCVTWNCELSGATPITAFNTFTLIANWKLLVQARNVENCEVVFNFLSPPLPCVCHNPFMYLNFKESKSTVPCFLFQARKNELAIEDMDGGTFTISNGGVFGSLFGTPIINPPQSAILGMHGIFDRPVAVAGKVSIGWKIQRTSVRSQYLLNHRIGHIDTIRDGSQRATLTQLV